MKRFISIYLGGNPQNVKGNQNQHCEAFIEAVRAIKINDNDSNSRKNAIESYEKAALKLFEKAGHSNRRGFSCKMDTFNLDGFGPFPNEKILKFGTKDFIEYYNGIKIESGGASIKFDEGKIEMMSLFMFANDDVPIVGTEPKISFDEALGIYLSSKKITLKGKPKGDLCYFLSPDQSLKLCWRFMTDAGQDSKIAYVNALSGQTEKEIGNLEK